MAIRSGLNVMIYLPLGLLIRLYLRLDTNNWLRFWLLKALDTTQVSGLISLERAIRIVLPVSDFERSVSYCFILLSHKLPMIPYLITRFAAEPIFEQRFQLLAIRQGVLKLDASLAPPLNSWNCTVLYEHCHSQHRGWSPF